MTTRQFGQFNAGPTSTGSAARAPQCGQNRLPTNIIPKHFGQAIVASRVPQYRQDVSSLEIAAPQVGQ
jgi:hypothetical protein